MLDKVLKASTFTKTNYLVENYKEIFINQILLPVEPPIRELFD